MSVRPLRAVAVVALAAVGAAWAPPPADAAYGATTVLAAGTPVGHVKLRYRGSRAVGLVAGANLVAVLAPAARVTRTLAGVPGDLDGPLAQGARVGRVVVRADGRFVGSVAAVTQSPVPRSSLGQRLRDLLGKPSTRLALAALVGCSLMLTNLRVRTARRARAGRRRAPTQRIAA